MEQSNHSKLIYSKKDIVRFYSKINNSIDDKKCWIWNAYKDDDGYGKFSILGKTRKAHQFSYEYYHGPIPFGMCVCHTCDNRSCVNPNHLFLGTQQDNTKDRNSKNRQIKGSNHPHANLTEQLIWEMLNLIYSGELNSVKEISNKYNISNTNVYRILSKKAWNHISCLFPIDLKILKSKIKHKRRKN
jgi:hypothetical protein